MAEPYASFSSRVIPLPAENVDTDQIVPARYLKVTDKAGLGDALFRDWRFETDGSIKNPAFVLDTTFNLTGSLDMPGYSQSGSGIVGKIDSTAVAIDTADGAPWYYEYVVTPYDCRLGFPSNTADFPTLCAGTPSTVSQSGATGGGSGDTIVQAWVMNAGDTINITAAAGLVIAKTTRPQARRSRAAAGAYAASGSENGTISRTSSSTLKCWSRCWAAGEVSAPGAFA